MTEDTATAPAPTAGTFDLGSFIAEKATYARYKCTIHLAGEEANQSVALAQQIETLQKEREELVKKADKDNTQVSIGETSPTTTRLNKIDRQIKDLTKQRKPLVETVKASALTFYFAVTSRDVQSRISERINELLAENDEDATTTDPEQIQARVTRKMSRDPKRVMYQTAVMMRELTVEVRNADDAHFPIDNLTEEALVELLNIVPLSEITRLNDSMALAMTGAQDFDRAVDAGFPR